MRSTGKGLALVAIGAVTAAAGIGACSGDETTSTTGSSGSGSCEPRDAACPALDVESDCLALTDNSGKQRFALRLAQLSVTQPAVLASPTVQTLIGNGVNPNLESCNIYGYGTFSLITEFDLANEKLTIGGAYPEIEPQNGYCYVYDEDDDIEPLTVGIEVASDLSFSIDPIERIVVPVFYPDVTSTETVLLPIRQAVLLDGKISADHNCIGRYNADGLEPANNCLPDPDEGIDYFVNGGKLEGYITLEEADAVPVDLLGQSLCVLLSGDPKTYGDGDATLNKCKRTGGKIDLEGDWCSTTNSAGGCRDAFRLSAEFAASAASLRDDCPSPNDGAGGGGAGGGG